MNQINNNDTLTADINNHIKVLGTNYFYNKFVTEK